MHQERGWTYALAVHAGHLVGYTNPVSVSDDSFCCLARSNTLGVGPHARSGVYLWQQPNRTRHQRQLRIRVGHSGRGRVALSGQRNLVRPSRDLLWFRYDRVYLYLPDCDRESLGRIRCDRYCNFVSLRTLDFPTNLITGKALVLAIYPGDLLDVVMHDYFLLFFFTFLSAGFMGSDLHSQMTVRSIAFMIA